MIPTGGRSFHPAPPLSYYGLVELDSRRHGNHGQVIGQSSSSRGKNTRKAEGCGSGTTGITVTTGAMVGVGVAHHGLDGSQGGHQVGEGHGPPDPHPGAACAPTRKTTLNELRTNKATNRAFILYPLLSNIESLM